MTTQLEPELLDAVVGTHFVVVACPHDGHSLIAWQFFDGPRGCSYGQDEWWTHDRVGYAHDGRNVGEPLPGQDAHFRFNITCPTEGCTYRKVLTQETVARVIYPLLVHLAGMSASGHHVIADVDRYLRSVANG